MRVYRTDREGVQVLRLSGEIDRADAEMLSSRLGGRIGGCCILDFAGVRHVDYRAFGILERLTHQNHGVIFSGFSDYLLSILVFVSDMEMAPIFSTWRTALRWLQAERGKLGAGAAVGA
jgi:ABC-type transporter Mla MlaB component